MAGEEFLSQYKLLELLEKRMNVYETQINSLGQEMSRIRNMAAQSRDDLLKLTTAMLGSPALGMEGALARIEILEKAAITSQVSMTRIFWLLWCFLLLQTMTIGIILWAILR